MLAPAALDDVKSENLNQINIVRNLAKSSILVAAAATVLALLAAEWLAGQYLTSGTGAERMDAGLLDYDRLLGWRLARRWEGQHVHQDYDARYTTNAYGYRGAMPSPAAQPASNARRVAVVGDSFTFGLGVNDGDTFVHLLDRTRPSDEVLNFGVPGYSTDQQLLLLRRSIAGFKPKLVILVVYLGNDLLDNMRSFPLQADYGKPFFELRDGRLTLQNTPVPRAQKPAALRSESLGSVVFGSSGGQRSSGVERWLSTTTIGRLIASLDTDRDPIEAGERLESRLQPHLELVRALIQQFQAHVERSESTLVLALLSGRSMLVRPRSDSALFQAYSRDALREVGKVLELQVIDVPAAMAARKEDPQLWYFPNDGHLTKAGHAVVAGIIGAQLP